MRRWIAVLGVAVGLLCASPLAAAPAPADSAPLRLLTYPLPKTPGYHLLKGVVEIGGKSYPFATGLFLPRAWFESKSPLPLVITLHNRGLNGSDSYALGFEGLGQLLATDNQDSRRSGERSAHPVHLRTDAQFVGLAPQCPPGLGWESPGVAGYVGQLITVISDAYHLDPGRVCLTGFSYGASSTWAIALQIPQRFSAIAPIAGRQTKDPAHDVLKLKGLPIYLAIGGDDQNIPHETQHMHDALVAAGHEPLEFRVIQGGNHFAYPAVYEDPAFWNWMLSQRIGAPTTQPTLDTHYPVYPPPPPVQTQTPPQGHGILCQTWRDIPGNTLAALREDASYPNFPSEQRVLPTMQIPRSQPRDFGTVLCGWVLPPVSGDYTFYLASQDEGTLLLSRDDQPQHLRAMAAVSTWTWPDDWTQTHQQQSEPVHLEQGRRYYIEAVQKAGEGDNHLAVAWKLPDGSLEGPIGAEHLEPAPAARVPGPQIVEMDPTALPHEPGIHRVACTIEYRGHRKPVSVLYLMPRAIGSNPPPPALVYCPDPDRRRPDGFPPPLGALAALASPALAEWSPFVVIEPQSPAGASWEVPSTSRSVAMVIDRLLHELPVDPTRVYLTGSNAGGTDAWRVALRLKGRFTALAPINAMEVNAGNLTTQLAGTAVRIITGVKNGVATDCANRMKDRLATLQPKPDVVYEMQMGDEVAGLYYSKRDFYDWLLGWRRAPGGVAVQAKPPATQP